jgi:hypothetical protein
LIKKARRHVAEIGEITGAQRVGQRQHLQPSGHAPHLGIEREAKTARGLQHPLRCFLAVLFVIVENNAGREDDQRQHGARDQKNKTHWERKLWHKLPGLLPQPSVEYAQHTGTSAAPPSILSGAWVGSLAHFEVCDAMPSTLRGCCR